MIIRNILVCMGIGWMDIFASQLSASCFPHIQVAVGDVLVYVYPQCTRLIAIFATFGLCSTTVYNARLWLFFTQNVFQILSLVSTHLPNKVYAKYKIPLSWFESWTLLLKLWYRYVTWHKNLRTESISLCPELNVQSGLCIASFLWKKALSNLVYFCIIKLCTLFYIIMITNPTLPTKTQAAEL